MLSVEDNHRITEVGPGTPMGELMRRYWHPIAAAAELDDNPTKEVRLLGEDLVLYRDRAGTYGLIDRYCAHRRVNLAYGIPEARGLRCMYHGWLYDETGQCAEQPFEETVRPEARFKDKIKLKGYPVQELAGVLFAYMGPAPVPHLPLWDLFLKENVVREIVISTVPCNWLQCMENSMDPVHVEWLHVNYRHFILQRRGEADNSFPTVTKHTRIGFDVFDHGIIKRRIVEGQTEEDDDWRIGHPVIFPHILQVSVAGVSGNYQYRVPIDDHNTLHVTFMAWYPAPGFEAPHQDRTPYRYVPVYDEEGLISRDYTVDQDKLSWIIQGPLMDRSKEHVGESDRGVILYRKLLQEQMAIAADGGDPMNVFRTEESARVVTEAENIPFRKVDARYVPLEAGETPARAEIEQVLATWAR